MINILVWPLAVIARRRTGDRFREDTVDYVMR